MVLCGITSSDDGDREGGGGGGVEPVPAHITSWKEKQVRGVSYSVTMVMAFIFSGSFAHHYLG